MNRISMILFCAMISAHCLAQTLPSTKPTSQPTTTTAPSSRPINPNLEAHRARLLEFLHGEYARLIKNSDWVTRGLGVISLSRLPTPTATTTLFDIAKNDKNNAVQMLAWQGLLSRASLLTPEEQPQFVEATQAVMKRGSFRGSMRVALARALPLLPIDQPTRSAFISLFDSAKSENEDDQLLLRELGRTLALMRSTDLGQLMIAKVNAGGADAKRAVILLDGVGCPVSPFDSAQAYTRWWQTQRLEWGTKSPQVETLLKSLGPNLLPKVLRLADIDPDDKKWRRELEIGKPDLRNFDVAFAVDVSTSMTSSIEWLRRDLHTMLAALAIFAREPRIGLTFFDCKGGRFGVKTIPLTPRIETLSSALIQMRVQGGGDELVYPALVDVITKNGWSDGPRTPKVLIFVSDEDISEDQYPQCIDYVAQAAKNGFRAYALSPNSTVPRTYVRFAEAGKGMSFPMNLGGYRRVTRPGAPATLQPAGGIGTREILLQIVTDALSSEYRERAAPLVDVVMQMTVKIEPR